MITMIDVHDGNASACAAGDDGGDDLVVIMLLPHRNRKKTASAKYAPCVAVKAIEDVAGFLDRASLPGCGSFLNSIVPLSFALLRVRSIPASLSTAKRALGALYNEIVLVNDVDGGCSSTEGHHRVRVA